MTVICKAKCMDETERSHGSNIYKQLYTGIGIITPFFLKLTPCVKPDIHTLLVKHEIHTLPTKCDMCTLLPKCDTCTPLPNLKLHSFSSYSSLSFCILPCLHFTPFSVFYVALQECTFKAML